MQIHKTQQKKVRGNEERKKERRIQRYQMKGQESERSQL